MLDYDRRRFCSADANAAAGGGGGAPAAAPAATPPASAATPPTPAAPPAAAANPDLSAALAKALQELAELKAGKKVADDADAQKAAGDTTKKLADLEKAVKDATAAQAKAQQAAVRAHTLAYLQGLAKESYAALAPEVKLDDAGALTKESKEALDKFRQENPSLFTGAGNGAFTPGSAGPGATPAYTPQQLQEFKQARIDPSKFAEQAKHPLAWLIGHGRESK